MKKSLGKGLNALIPDIYVNKQKTDQETSDPPLKAKPAPSSLPQEGPFRLIPISQIAPNPDQSRQAFSPEAMEELAASIKEKGILQPIIVNELSRGRYMLVCGERRLRAAALCGLTEVPAIVKDIAAADLLEWALIENIQRQDLNPIEEAEAYQRLAEERMLSQDEISKRVGKDRSSVANMLRLLHLPIEVRQYLADGRLSAGHARALLGMLTPEHQRQLARRIAEENLSVRQVEMIVNRSNAHKRKPKNARHLSPEIIDLESRLAQHFGTQVRVYPRKDQKQGRIEIHYFSLDDLDRILDRSRLPQK